MRPQRRAPSQANTDATNAHYALGKHGEDLACRWLQQRGYRLAGRNLALPSGEIDILVRRGCHWVAVEVKARRNHPAPERCVTKRQLDRIEAGLWSLSSLLRPRASKLQIDIIAIRWSYDRSVPHHASPEIHHFERVRELVPSPGSMGLACNSQGFRSKWPNYWAQHSFMINLAEQMIPRRKVLLLFSETVLFMMVILVGTSAPPLSTHSFLLLEPSADLWRGVLTSLTIAIICQASLSYNELYDWKVSQNRASLANRLVHSYGYSLVMIGFLALVAGSLFYLPGIEDLNAETWKLILLVGIAYLLVFVFRNAFHWFFYKWRFGERVLVLGSAQEGLILSQMIQDNPMSGFEILGVIHEPGHRPAESVDSKLDSIGTIESLQATCRKEGISRVIVALKERRGQFPVEALLKCRMDGVIIEETEAMYERLTGKLAVESMRPSYLIYGRGFAKDPLTQVFKRVLDILTSTTGIVLSLPVCIVTVLAIKLTSRGSIFFTQERVGADGSTFRLIKFRTMRPDAEAASGPVWAAKNDSRVTRVGRFLRLTRIDEIPQFLNILGGQMSFVGPRPERSHFVEQLQRKVPFYPLRHTVKPGLTGWAQVCHPYGASIEDAQEKLRYDLYYIKNMSLLFDVSIMLRTVAVILRGSGAR